MRRWGEGGGEIAGTRINVYDIWDYARVGHHHTYIAVLLCLSSAQVLAAMDYIEKNKEEVLAHRGGGHPHYGPVRRTGNE